MAEHRSPDDSDLTADCLAGVSAYAPQEPDQQRLRAEVLTHLRGTEQGWSRACPGAHVTASALICSPRADRVLLIRHRKLTLWLQTGGHIEPTDRTLASAALREATEESGLPNLRLVPGIVHIDRHEVPCGPVRPTFHLDVRFLVIGDANEVPGTNAEVEDGRWFAVDELPTDEPSVLTLVTRAQQRLG
ncbi:MAG: NUDIX hydrolase [Propionibacteriaceae bacterium]|nr:NUDIX hydrolase [Propionibacteriaceae bacterium]